MTNDPSTTAPSPSTVSSAEAGVDFYPLSVIAKALGLPKTTARRRAKAWPMQREGNRELFAPPADVSSRCASIPQGLSPAPIPTVRFADLRSVDEQAAVLAKEQAVLHYRELLRTGTGIELAMASVACACGVSPRSVRSWISGYTSNGLDGLVIQKRGVVGRKAAVDDMTPEEILQARALAIEHGVGGRPNVARALREMEADPALSAGARRHIHSARASKSSMPPSIRAAVKTSPLLTTLVQVGRQEAALSGRFTPCHYEDSTPGDVWTADDMTANVYVWVEWPNDKGYLILRPQVLAAMDVVSQCWLSCRVVIRSKSQYCKDDVWGLVGDLLDQYGRPKAFLFEGGTWRSNVVTGAKTGHSDDARFGGLRALGIQLRHAIGPRSKIIEGAFNSLQAAMDNCRGFCGRAEREDRPEPLKEQLYQIEKGQAHPRQYLMHAREFSAHVQSVMNVLNNERNDGQALRGLTPAQRWAEAPALEQFPAESKWLYRSAWQVTQVTRNGIMISARSGKYRETYHYDAGFLPGLEGRKVAVFWNDHSPEADAAVLEISGRVPGRFLGMAQAVTRISRFNASKDELSAEAARKAAAMRAAVVESKSLAPYLQRQYGTRPAPMQERDAAVHQQLEAARDRVREQERAEERTHRRVMRTEGTIDDLAVESSTPRPTRETAPVTVDELESL